MRYKKLPNRKGIYEDIKSGNYYCQKRIKKKLYSETFSNIREALHWVKTYHPDNVVYSKRKVGDLDDLNGKVSVKVSEVWDRYFKEHVKSLEITTQEQVIKTMPFFASIMDNDVRHVTPTLVTDLILTAKEKYLKSGKDKRFSFSHELKYLRAMLTWWRENGDYTFICPVIKKRHWKLGVIKPKRSAPRVKMDIDLVSSFISECYRNGSNNGLYAMLAEIQFLTMTRIQEACCIQTDQIDFDNRVLTIDRALAFTREKGKENYVKGTKNNEYKLLRVTDRMKQIFLTLINNKPSNCEFLFQIDGRPLTYRQIQYAYNKGLQGIGVYPIFSSTHIMRHAAAHSVREFSGIDTTQAMGGWKSQGLAEHYSGLSSKLSEEGVIELEKRLKVVR